MSAEEKYADIINIPYKKSGRHPHMPAAGRAAQFAPFAALTGYSDEIDKIREDAERDVLNEIETEKI